jgi:hypothetical protein
VKGLWLSQHWSGMRMITLLSLNAILLAAAPPPTFRTTVPNEIARLDDCIQTRFLDRKAFGMMRISPSQFHGRGIFQPENPTEHAAVEQLKEKGFEVAVYLVGRQALDARPFPTRRSGLQGPAAITLPAETQLPEQAAILSEGRSALAKIGHERGYETRVGDWSVAIRPLRASNQTCIQCHTTVAGAPKLGDALGIVMYVYRHD